MCCISPAFRPNDNPDPRRRRRASCCRRPSDPRPVSPPCARIGAAARRRLMGIRSSNSAASPRGSTRTETGAPRTWIPGRSSLRLQRESEYCGSVGLGATTNPYCTTLPLTGTLRQRHSQAPAPIPSKQFTTNLYSVSPLWSHAALHCKSVGYRNRSREYN